MLHLHLGLLEKREGKHGRQALGILKHLRLRHRRGHSVANHRRDSLFQRKGNSAQKAPMNSRNRRTVIAFHTCALPFYIYCMVVSTQLYIGESGLWSMMFNIRLEQSI